MSPVRERALAAVVAAVLVLVATTVLWMQPGRSIGGRAWLDGVLVAVCFAIAAVTFSRYLDERDPEDLLIGSGFLMLGAQTTVFGLFWISSSPQWEGFALSSLAWDVGWLVAAACALLARPWWERRGRRPITAPVVLAGSAFVVLALDLLLVLFRHSLSRVRNVELRTTEAFATSSLLHWLLAAGTAGAFGVAAYRTWTGAKGRGGGLTAAAWIVAAFGQVAFLARPIGFRPIVMPADALPIGASALVFAGVLVRGRAEVSRMRRASDRADEIMGGRAEIAAMVSHEVRGPVSTIRGLAATARNQYERLSDGERREFLGLIEQESGRLLETATQASLGLKVDAATLAFDLRPQELEPVIAAGAGAAAVGDRPLRLSVDDGLRAAVDRRWFSEIVRQLIDNAAKFSPPETAIDLSARRDGTAIVVEVSDLGPGIDAEQREAVFEKFTTWRPEGYSEAAGSGLGLFICRGIVAEHGGDISIEDRAGGGTILRVRIPATED